MAGKIESRIIDGLDVKVGQFGALDGVRLLKRVGAACAPAFSAAAAAGLTVNDNAARLVPALGAMLERLEDPAELLGAILRGTIVTFEGRAVPLSEPAMIDHVFTGRIGTLLKVAAFALEVNFGDFIGAAIASAKAVVAAQPAAAAAEGASA